MSNSAGKLIVKGTTWLRDSHGLFDYEAKNYEHFQSNVEESVQLALDGDRVHAGNPESLLENSQTLLYIIREPGRYIIASKLIGKSTEGEQIWAVVKRLPSCNKENGYRISEGDIIRLGRFQLRVYEMGGYENSQTPYEYSPIDSQILGAGGLNPPNTVKQIPSTANPADAEEEEVQCRICFGEGVEAEDPLITPCNCTGTMANIHLNCLKSWFSTKTVTREHQCCKTYSLQQLECEICKLKYPEHVQVKGEVIKLFNIPKPEGHYLMLEEISRNQGQSFTVHVINLEFKQNVRLGRGNDSDIRISDISVSRNHAFIRVSRMGLYLEDNSSKFGTLVLLRRPIIIDNGAQCCLQSGRTMFEFEVKKPWSWCSCFAFCSKGAQEEVNSREITNEY